MSPPRGARTGVQSHPPPPNTQQVLKHLLMGNWVSQQSPKAPKAGTQSWAERPQRWPMAKLLIKTNCDAGHRATDSCPAHSSSNHSDPGLLFPLGLQIHPPRSQAGVRRWPLQTTTEPGAHEDSKLTQAERRGAAGNHCGS